VPVVLPGNIAKTISGMSTLNPLNQRLIIGVTALPLMTGIDFLNPYVDKETRKTSAIRTAIKTVICTCSGMLARYLGGKVGTRLVKNGTIVVPKGVPAAAFGKRVGDVFMVLAGIASVFVIDIPFINRILNAVMKTGGGHGHETKPKTGINHLA
jgi:hypothetical protein